MLSNPPIPHLGRDFNDEATEVENYEVRSFPNSKMIKTFYDTSDMK